MKKFTLVFSAVLTLFLISCEGPEGPPVFDGLDGVNIVGQSFERTIDFTFNNGYQETLEIPLDIELLESDMVLVYRLVDIVDGFDVWKLLPETVFTENGQFFQYDFEHNFDFVTIFIDAPTTFDFNDLLPGDTDGQTFRVVILPIDFVNSINLNVNDLNSVMNYVELN